MDFVFLVCSERSGSNFLTSLMNGHPDVSAPPPSHLFRLFCQNIHRYGNTDHRHTWELLCEDFLIAFESTLGKWNTSPGLLELVGQSRRLDALLRYVYEKEARNDAANLCFVKENKVYDLMTFLTEWFPLAKFVHLVRDPRDVAASLLNTRSMEGGVRRATSMWQHDQEKTTALLLDKEYSDKFCTVRYEDILLDPETELGRLCDHIQREFSLKMLDFHMDDRVVKNALRIEAWSNLKKGILSSNAGKYQNTLSPTDIAYVEQKCAKLMNYYGYDCHTDPQLPPVSEGSLSNKSGVELSPEEKKIRNRRLEAIQRVINR